MTIVESVGWVLVHFVWQGIAIALTLAAVLSLTSAAQAALRYALSCAALLLMFAAAVLTAADVIAAAQRSPPAPGAAGVHRPPAADPTILAEPASAARGGTIVAAATASREAAFTDDVLSSVRPIVVAALPWLVATWACGVVLLSIRLCGGWWRTRRLRVEGTSAPPDWCQASLTALAERMGIARPVAVLASVRVRVPLVLGHVKPVIVIPAAVFAGLNVAQLEAIIAHELAHVRRHDYLVNLAQSVIETLLFYHPAVWWVSRQIRDAREHCCDDLAVGVCRSRQQYVHALLGLEELKLELRKPGALLALGAADGPLLARARRLLVPPDRTAAAPRLAASVIALTIVGVAVTGASFAAGRDAAMEAGSLEPFGASAEPAASVAGPLSPSAAAPAQELPASSVVVAPDAAGPLGARWAWAERSAREARRARYWIGYTITPVHTLPPVVYMDTTARVLGDNISLSGTILGSSAGGFRFPGRRLPVAGSDRVVKVLFAFDASRGTPALTAVHASSHTLPVDTKDLPIYWLGMADAAGSQAQIDRLYKAASTIDLQNDLIAAIGMHAASPAVVAWLEGRVSSGDADTLRAEATEWIAYHPIARSVAALDRIAREDRVSRVRQEAAEAMGDLQMPEAAPALVGLARELQDRDARLEAVEALGARPESLVRDALVSIAREDPILDVQREAVETLGDLSDGRGVPALIDLARTHPRVDVRREAIEALGDRVSDGRDTRQAEDRSTVLDALSKLAASDVDVEVQAAAAEALGAIPGPEAVARLRELIGSQADERVRVQAVEALGDHGPGADVAPLLKRIALDDPSPRVADEAIEALADLSDGAGIAALTEIVREQPETRIWRRALEALVDSDDPRARDVFKLLKGNAKR